jgi:3-oxoacyl-[acyl-carrier protein] reductase
LTARRVLVAGSTGQLGRTIARDLAAAGYSIALHYNTQRTLAEELATSLEGDHVAVQLDLADRDAVESGIARLTAEWGSVDDLVNTAWPGVPTGPLEGYDDGRLDSALLGVRMHANLCRAVLPGLRSARGSVVFLGGASATRLHPGLGLFAAGKAAATVMTHVLALEEGAHGVRANVISPGRVAVASGDLAEEDPVFAALDRVGELRRVLPLPTVGEIAATVRWLLSSQASGITGQTIALAGGEVV